MRKIFHLIAVAAAVSLAACSGSSDKGGKKFAAQEKESTMTDAERQAAIEAKRASLAELDTAVLTGNGIKLTIMTPTADEENHVTEKMSTLLANKLLAMATKNGISGMGGDPAFVLAAGITGLDKKLTGTAPQKTMLTYDLTMYVGNVVTGTVFGSATVKLVGVGNNERQAADNAVAELKDSKEIQQMLANSTAKIIDYYNTHAAEIKAQAETAIAQGNYDEAYGLLYSVPSQATELFAYAEEKLPGLGEKMFAKQSSQNLAALKSVIAGSNGHFNPEAGALLAMIRAGTPEYAEAQKLYGEYDQRIQTTAANEMAAAERKAAADREFEMKKMELAAKNAKKMSSREMRRRIAYEDAQSSPFKMRWYKLCYGLSDKFPTKDDED